MTLGKFNFILSVSLIYYFVSCINCHYSEQGRLYLKLQSTLFNPYRFRWFNTKYGLNSTFNRINRILSKYVENTDYVILFDRSLIILSLETKFYWRLFRFLHSIWSPPSPSSLRIPKSNMSWLVNSISSYFCEDRCYFLISLSNKCWSTAFSSLWLLV